MNTMTAHLKSFIALCETVLGVLRGSAKPFDTEAAARIKIVERAQARAEMRLHFAANRASR